MLFYDVEIPELEKIFSAAYALSITGNVNIAKLSGKVHLAVSEPLNA